MSQLQIEIDTDGEGTYRVNVPSLDGPTQLTLRLVDAPGVSDGRLEDDEATARATVAFLLGHQDAADLPPMIHIGDVVAAYDDAIDRIEALRA